jgi:ubiquinone/menaquinone biosynthesis C-methylase UbiE
MPVSAHDVALANERFYDRIAPVYDQVDSRRSGGDQHRWVDRILDEIRAEAPPGPLHFLDAGSGSGFLARRAVGSFDRVSVLDISKEMLARIDVPGAEKIHGDCTAMPIADGSVDVVGAFATLHHLYDPVAFFRESHRVLAPGGVLYTDHDIERRFVRRFKLPLALHRALFDHGKGYLRACPEATQEDYALSEFHGDRGLDGPTLAKALEQIGFRTPTVTYHWEGMAPFHGVLERAGIEARMSRRGRAPILRLIAVRE